MLFNKKKENEPQLDTNVASQMLQNVFDVCEVESNSVPLDVLLSYSNYRKERFALQKVVLLVVLVLFCAMPLLFMAPKMNVSETSDVKYNPTYEVKIDTVVPINYVSAAVDGNNVPVYETSAKTYSVEPNRNGTMNITVELINGQYKTKTLHVKTVDTAAPTVTSNRLTDNKIYLHLSDKDSGVNYKGIYATEADGTTRLPASYDEGRHVVVFNYPENSLNVYIPDKAKNTLQLVLTVK